MYRPIETATGNVQPRCSATTVLYERVLPPRFPSCSLLAEHPSAARTSALLIFSMPRWTLPERLLITSSQRSGGSIFGSPDVGSDVGTGSGVAISPVPSMAGGGRDVRHKPLHPPCGSVRHGIALVADEQEVEPVPVPLRIEGIKVENAPAVPLEHCR